jgi:cysteinyl-tRNA synthetase
MGIRIYNTLTKKKEDFIPIEPGKVKFYLCGPTVYDYFHIGNARPFIVFDVFRRYLEYRGFDVTFVVNITDVDDKIINRAHRENRSPADVAEEFTRAYFEDLEKLRIRRATVHPKATEHIAEMIALIRKLEERGIAYRLNGDVYYNVEKFPDYGRLSGKKLEELQAGARVEVDERKRNPLDFALWKAAKPGEPAWDSPWGKGRPGWHIECSAMSMKYLGPDFDIHAGGEDLIFPHHENEIAQSCGAGSAQFARYWMHNGFLNIRGEKMSKSLGNVLTVREILKQISPEVIRLFFLQKHYRSPINYSEDILEETERAWRRLQNTYGELLQVENIPEDEFLAGKLPDRARAALQELAHHRSAFEEAMDDDFNSARAIGHLFEIVKLANRILAEGKPEGERAYVLSRIRKTLEGYDSFLSLLRKEESPATSGDFEKVMELLLEVRNSLRKKKLFDLADEIRSKLHEMGYQIEDRPDGSVWKKMS